MSIRELRLSEFEAEWPRLQSLIAGEEAEERRERLAELLSRDGAYALLDEADGSSPTGLALIEHYQSAWIFADHVAAIREWIAPDSNSRRRLLDAIEQRACGDGMAHLQRFLTTHDEALSWWYRAGFVEYMTAFRLEIEATSRICGPDTRDGIRIRAVTDVDSDWPKLWPLFEQLDRHHASLTGRPLHERREENARRSLQHELDTGKALIMLAEADGKAIATSTAELGERDSDGTLIGYRSRLYVEEPYRGRRLATRFEDVALGWFRERNVTHVERWIVAGNEKPRQIWTVRGYKPARILLRKGLPV